MIKKIALPVIATLALVAGTAQADPVPEDMLAKDYQACMGGFTEQQDALRGQYCKCVHDKLKSWDMDTYGNVATEASKSGDSASASAKIQELAQSCMQQVGHW